MTTKTVSFATKARRPGRVATMVMAAGLAILAAPGSVWADDLEKVTFRTNWLLQAEHGGWHHADSQGTYEDYGLDVEMAPSGQILNAVEEGLPVVALAAFYQKDPQIIMTHPGVGNDRLEDLKGKSILLSQDAHQSFWPWLKQKYGYTDEQVRPYTFQMGLFIAEPQVIQQAYVTSETF